MILQCLGLQTKLAAVEEQLAQHKAQESKCVKASQDLEAKLQAASQQVTSLQSRLSSLEAEASQLKQVAKVGAVSLYGMVVPGHPGTLATCTVVPRRASL